MDKIEYNIAKSYIKNDSAAQRQSEIVCYRCSLEMFSVNIFELQKQKETGLVQCPNCLHPFIFSFCSHETLPLVEFAVSDDLSQEEVLIILDGTETKFSEEVSEEINFDVFICSFDFESIKTNEYKPIIIGKEVLEGLCVDEVYMIPSDYSKTPTFKFYKNMIPEMAITLCDNCFTFYGSEELDEETLTNGGKCLFCKQPIF